jgi:Lrp/AsnC family transcriptional regulator, leucine-responsive regulatory protein
MKLGQPENDFDDIDLHILALLQENCKLPLAKIGEKVGLSAPSVIERIKKLEDQEVIAGYRALLNARHLGKDVTAFIGVTIRHPKVIGEFEQQIVQLDDVLECHHVTGQHTLLLKVKTANTSSLEELISKLRSIEGVDRTETMVVLSTHTERTQIAIRFDATLPPKRPRRNGEKQPVHLKGV